MNSMLRLADSTTIDLEVRDRRSGIFGVVYCGPDKMAGRRWRALKALRPLISAAQPSTRERFISAGLTWMSIWPHANLVSVEGIATINHHEYIALPYATHGNMRKCIRNGVQFGQALLFAQMIAAGLKALHNPDPIFPRNWIAHGNLKPENILIQDHGLAQLSDIGLVNVVKNDTRSLLMFESSGARGDTIAYRAPEQWASARKVSRKADMYAFGIILYELLTGHHPLCDSEDIPDEARWRWAHEHSQPRGLRSIVHTLPAVAEELYLRCLSRHPAQRPTAHEALTVLQRVARQLKEPVYSVQDVLARTTEHAIVALERLATTFAQFHCSCEARQLVEHILSLDPQNPVALNIQAGLPARRNWAPQDGASRIAQAQHHQATAVASLARRTSLLGKANRYSSSAHTFS